MMMGKHYGNSQLSYLLIKRKALSSQTELLKLLCRCARLSITWPDQSVFWTDGFSTSSCLLACRHTQSISPSVWTSRLSVQPSAIAVHSPLLLLTFTRNVIKLLIKLVNNNIILRTHRKFYIRGSVHRNSRLKKSNEMRQYADIYLVTFEEACSPDSMRLQLQFYVLLMMGAMDARNMYSNLAVNKYLHTVASSWISST